LGDGPSQSSLEDAVASPGNLRNLRSVQMIVMTERKYLRSVQMIVITERIRCCCNTNINISVGVTPTLAQVLAYDQH
jgi:hypothetical protein